MCVCVCVCVYVCVHLCVYVASAYTARALQRTRPTQMTPPKKGGKKKGKKKKKLSRERAPFKRGSFSNDTPKKWLFCETILVRQIPMQLNRFTDTDTDTDTDTANSFAKEPYALHIYCKLPRVADDRDG